MEQASFNFMAAVTICSDFRAQKSKVCYCSNLHKRALNNFLMLGIQYPSPLALFSSSLRLIVLKITKTLSPLKYANIIVATYDRG